MRNFTKQLFGILMLGMVVSSVSCGKEEEENAVTPVLVVDPSIISISPNKGTIGTEITIKGTGFLANAGVMVGTEKSTVVEVDSDSIIYAMVPSGIPANTPLSVTVNNSDGGTIVMISAFTAVEPKVSFINSATKPSGTIGSTVIVEGHAFGDVQGESQLLFSDGAGGTIAATITNPEDWTNTFIVTTVPQGAQNGPVLVETAIGLSNSLEFTIADGAVFSPSQINWTLSTSLPVAVSGHQAVFVPIEDASGNTHQFVHITGGRDANAQAQNQVLYGEIGTDGNVSAWESTLALAEPLSSHAMIAATPFNAKVKGSGYLYVLGGANAGGEAVSSVSFASLNEDGSVNGWNAATQLPEPLHSFGAVIFRSAIYIAGGATTGNAPVAKVYKAEIDTLGRLGEWNQQITLPSARANQGFVTFGGYLYAVGGETGTVSPDDADFKNNDTKLGEIVYAKISIRTGNILEAGWVKNESALQKSRSKHTTLVAGGNILVSSGLYSAAGQGSSENTYAQISSDGTLGSFGGATGSNTLFSVGGNHLFNQAGISYTDANGVARVMIIGGDDVNTPGQKQAEVIYY